MEYEHLDICQRHFGTSIYRETSFNRSSVESSDFSEMQFYSCSFDRSSLISLRIDKCKFEHCQFKNVDLIGCNFCDCVFRECDFSLANVADNTFSNCTFSEVEFRGAEIKENEFLSTKFIHSSLRGSNTCLNTFRRTSITDSEFGNCTADYNILENCAFNRSILNIEAIGSFYGMTLDSLRDSTILRLGTVQEAPSQSVIFDAAYNDFKRGNHYVQLFICELNLSRGNLIECTERLCERMRASVLDGGYLPADQLTFLFNVFKEFYRKECLGFLPLNKLIECVQSILDETAIDSRFYERLILLHNHLELLRNALIRDFAELSDWERFKEDEPIIVRFTFQRKPKVPVVDLLSICHQHVFDQVPAKPPLLLAELTGSYIAVIQTTVFTLLAFRLCAHLLVGSVKELVKLRANVSLLAKKKLPQKYVLEVTKPETNITIPQVVAALLTGLLEKTLPSPLKTLDLEEISTANLTEVTEKSAGALDVD